MAANSKIHNHHKSQ